MRMHQTGHGTPRVASSLHTGRASGMTAGNTNAARKAGRNQGLVAGAGPEDDDGDTVIDDSGLPDWPVDVEIEIAPGLPLDVDVSANE